MPKKPNYRYERSERERVKAAKKAARLAARQEKTQTRKDGGAGDPSSGLKENDTEP